MALEQIEADEVFWLVRLPEGYACETGSLGRPPVSALRQPQVRHRYDPEAVDLTPEEEPKRTRAALSQWNAR